MSNTFENANAPIYFLVIYSMWSSHVRLSSIINPTYFTIFTLLISKPLKYSLYMV